MMSRTPFSAPLHFISSSGTKHCTIEWDGDETSKSAVILTDTSTNGTFVSLALIHGVRVALMTIPD